MLKKFYAFSICFLCLFELHAQKVGVVLSGGGAWGVAHIGVLKELEKNQIPIDFVAGTSMGALIAGMYAGGYSPEEMEQIVMDPSFQSLVTGRIPQEYVYYFKMNEPNASILNLKLNLDSGQLRTSLPTGLISAYNYDFKMMELLAPAAAAADYNFDSLFVPFRCVGADIMNKRQVVFRRGYLPSAVRASATYPLYMRPIKIDDVLMFDGGLYNNFPADVLDRDFNPQIIIGSNVTGPGGSTAPSEDDLIAQIKTMVMAPTNYDAICENMVIVMPNVPTSLFDFTNNRQSVEIGAEATREKLDSIKLYVHARRSTEELQARRNAFRTKVKELCFDEVYVTGLRKVQASYVQKLLTDPKSDSLSLPDLKKQYFQLVADEKIRDIYPMALYNKKTRRYDLYLKIKPDQSLEVSLGGNLSTKPYNTAFVGLKFKRLWNNALSITANGAFGRVYNSAHFDTRLDFPSKVPFSLMTFYNYNQYNYFRNLNFFIETKKQQVVVNQDEHTAGVSFGFPAGRQGKLYAGGAFVYFQNRYYQNPFFNTADTADKSLFRLGTANIVYEQNTFDRKQYPTRGAWLQASVRYVYGAEDYFPGSTSKVPGFTTRYAQWVQFRLAGEKFFFRYKKFRISLNGEFFYSTQPVFGNYRINNVMARQYSPLPEMANLFLPQFRSTEYIAGGTRLVYSIIKNLDLRGELHVFQPFREVYSDENGNAIRSATWFFRTYFLTSAVLVYHTPVGPVSLNYNYYHRTDRPHSVYFNIGFIIHNKRALE